VNTQLLAETVQEPSCRLCALFLGKTASLGEKPASGERFFQKTAFDL
jgi:hypothetical protein